MERIVIEGGKPLSGTIHISGAKNAVLPLIAAASLTDGECQIHEAPYLADVRTMSDVLEYLGAACDYQNGTFYIDASRMQERIAPSDYVRRMRASFLIMGPMLARFGRSRISLPGGCSIGARPIDLHLKGLEMMGADISIGSEYIDARANRLRGANIYLDYPSVGATENLMMAATLAEGQTILENVAEEPEIVDLANFLNSMGAKVKGAGTNIIRIDGVTSLKPTSHFVIPDRIEAGTFMVIAAMTKSSLFLENVISEHMKSLIAKMQEVGVKIIDTIDGLHVIPGEALTSADVKTLPYPGFPTDMQAQFMALLTIAHGSSTLIETVFENRFMHVAELKKMGADISIDGNQALITGVQRLYGAHVQATDLRAGAALIAAGLCAEGTTVVSNIDHIMRGYEDIVGKLSAVGADIRYE